MSTRPIRGMNATQASAHLRAIQSEKWDAEGTPINARCDKCNGDLRAVPSILAAIRGGFVDHAGCGGTFREITS